MITDSFSGKQGPGCSKPRTPRKPKKEGLFHVFFISFDFTDDEEKEEEIQLWLTGNFL